MKKGDYVWTPRFLTVRLDEVLTLSEAMEKGFTEPTHYKDPSYDIYGKSIGINQMIFSAISKTS